MTGARARRVLGLVAALVAIGPTGGCSLLPHKDDRVPIYDVQTERCFTAPEKSMAEIAKLNEVACSQPHTLESYAKITYTNPDGSEPPVYPGGDPLGKFAQGRCAAAYGPYVGVGYLDSKLFFTYLVPSARGWEQDKDRTVICFVTTTGALLTASVKGSKQ